MSEHTRGSTESPQAPGDETVGLRQVRRAAQALRQPLSLIVGPAQLLLETTGPGDPHHDELMLIARNSEVLIRRVDDLYAAVRAASKASLGFRQTGHTLARNLANLVQREGRTDLRETDPGSQRSRVLVVDDSPDTRFFVSAVLEPFASVVSVASGDEALAALRGAAPFDVVVSDVMMPGMRGDELARQIRADPHLMDTGILLLTGRSDPSFRAAVIHETVDDYLVKPFDTNELTARTLRLARDARSRAGLRSRALTDQLTQLPNRTALVERLARHLARRPSDLSVVIVDIDHFKLVNDTWGHGVGDEVLQQFAVALSRVPHVDGAIGRFGGEEFLLVLPDTAADEALDVARDLVAHVATSPMVTSAGDLAVSVSAGVATLSAADADWRALVARADLRLYEAKHAGRNRARGDEPARVTPA